MAAHKIVHDILSKMYTSKLFVFHFRLGSALEPLYNMVHYNTVLDITLIIVMIVGPQLDCFAICHILLSLGHGRKLAWTPAIIVL